MTACDRLFIRCLRVEQVDKYIGIKELAFTGHRARLCAIAVRRGRWDSRPRFSVIFQRGQAITPSAVQVCICRKIFPEHVVDRRVFSQGTDMGLLEYLFIDVDREIGHVRFQHENSKGSLWIPDC